MSETRVFYRFGCSAIFLSWSSSSPDNALPQILPCSLVETSPRRQSDLDSRPSPRNTHTKILSVSILVVWYTSCISCLYSLSGEKSDFCLECKKIDFCPEEKPNVFITNKKTRYIIWPRTLLFGRSQREIDIQKRYVLIERHFTPEILGLPPAIFACDIHTSVKRAQHDKKSHIFHRHLAIFLSDKKTIRRKYSRREFDIGDVFLYSSQKAVSI